MVNCRMGKLDLGAERRHCWVRESGVEALLESWHRAVKDCGLVFLRDRENVESKARLGTMLFDMTAAVNAEL